MTNQTLTCTLVLNTGEVVNMQTTTVDGTESEMQTSGTVGTGGGIAATSIGTYANGKTIISSAGVVAYAFLARRGERLRGVPVAGAEQGNAPMNIMPVTLQAGDSIRVLSVASTAGLRQVNYNVICTDGTNAIFTAQPATGTATTQLTHILSGQPIGSSLTGRSVAMHYANGTEGARYAGGCVLLVSDRGLPQGGCYVTNLANQIGVSNSGGRATISLNWQAQVTTIA